MRNYLAVLLFLLVAAPAKAQHDLRIASFNIRFDNPADSPNHWAARRDLVAGQLLFHEVHSVGIQEALHHQITDLLQRMPDYRMIGVGRDDGKTKGEYSCILYQHQRLQPLQSGHFWLSTTPEIPGSKSWDAAITRMVTWVQFKDLKTKAVFFHMNTHFDHVGREARRQSALLLLQKAREIAASSPIVLTGDLNTNPTDQPVQVLTNPQQAGSFYDAKSRSQQAPYGPQGTFNAFGPRETSDAPIDYILLRGHWQVKQYATLSQTWQGRFASDHFAVLAVLQWMGK